MRSLFFFLLFSASLQASAQGLHGVWEGKMVLDGKKKLQLNLRLELIKQESSYFGLLYSRGSDKGVVFGCDFFVSGNIQSGNLVLNRQKVQRAVTMSKSECSLMDYLNFAVNKNESASDLHGTWIWQDGNFNLVNLTKVDSSISVSAADEINEYLKQLYEAYETSGIMLPPESRLLKNMYADTVENNPMAVQISTLDSSIHDSVSVYVNEDRIISSQKLLPKPVRLRFDSIQPGDFEVIIVNESLQKSRIKVNVRIIQSGKVKETTLTATYTINPLILFTRKED